MEPVNTKIDYFYRQDLCQLRLSLFNHNSTNLTLSLFSNQGLKNKKNKVLNQIEVFKKNKRDKKKLEI
jgi:hypothetical protein